MKIRSAFVSNSSSSSFVMVGVRITEEELEKFIGLKRDSDEFWDKIYGELESEQGLVAYDAGDSIGGDGFIIGEQLADGDDYLEAFEVNSKQLHKTAKKLHKLFGEDKDVKIMGGTRAT